MSDWVFLRGLTRESAHWGDFPHRFETALPGARVHLLDLPGNGARHQERSPASVAAMVADVREQMRRLGIRTPVNLLALSLGAMVATEWAHCAPDDIGACVLINTSMRPFSPFHHRLQPHNYLALLKIVMFARSEESIEHAVFRMTCNRTESRDRTVTHWTRLRQQRPVRPGNALRQLLAAGRYRAPSHSPAVPLLLLNSTHDHLVSSRCSEAIAQAWACPLHPHPSAGHDLPQDDPAWVIERVREWIDEFRS